MVIKYFITCLVIAFAFNTVSAQHKYHPFSIEGQYGITDTLGNEVIKPSYNYITTISAKNQFYLQDFSDKPDIIFDAKTGTKQLYESVYDNKVQIDNVPYSIVSNKGKKILLSEKSNKTIALTRDYSGFENIGQYIIATYYAQDPFVSGGKDKDGNFLPPPIRASRNNYVVLANDESLKTIVDKPFDKYLALYIVPGENKEQNEEEGETIAKVVEIVLTAPNDNSASSFDYIVLSNGNNHQLYNGNMGLVESFVLPEADEEKLLQFCEKTLEVKLDTRSADAPGMLMNAPPMMASIGGNNKQPETKKPFKPYFYIKTLDIGITIFALQETEEISKRIFEASAKTKVRLNDRDCTIRVYVEGKDEASSFDYNPKTGIIYLPKMYLSKLGITLI